jgi:hypothetical protein
MAWAVDSTLLKVLFFISIPSLEAPDLCAILFMIQIIVLQLLNTELDKQVHQAS